LIFLDTNVLVYAIGTEHPAREPARRVIEAVTDGRTEATTTLDVIQEFVHVYSRRRPRSEAVLTGRRYATLLAPLAVPGPNELEAGLQLFEQHDGLGAFDAVLAATAQASDARALVSADRAFAAVKRLPFVELGSPEFDRLLGEE
jgi:predicted nucleic acid-binding protein